MIINRTSSKINPGGSNLRILCKSSQNPGGQTSGMLLTFCLKTGGQTSGLVGSVQIGMGGSVGPDYTLKKHPKSQENHHIGSILVSLYSKMKVLQLGRSSLKRLLLFGSTRLSIFLFFRWTKFLLYYWLPTGINSFILFNL